MSLPRKFTYSQENSHTEVDDRDIKLLKSTDFQYDWHVGGPAVKGVLLEN